MPMDPHEYAQFASRIVSALGRRVADGDTSDLALLRQLRDALDTAERVAVAAHREAGASWTEIGDGLGLTRQAAQQRYGAHRP